MARKSNCPALDVADNPCEHRAGHDGPHMSISYTGQRRTWVEYVTEEDKRLSSLAVVNALVPCGGIWVNGATPPVCEVHLRPWGHAPRQP